MCALGYAIKLWMVNEKREAVFGDGLAELLEEIDKYHSILKAAEHLEMSYRYSSSGWSEGRRLLRDYRFWKRLGCAVQEGSSAA